MKKQLITAALLVAVAFASCKKECQYPAAPYGTADDVSEFNSGSYSSITYTYYCRYGKYVSVTYTKEDGACSFKKSEYTSTGICKK